MTIIESTTAAAIEAALNLLGGLVAIHRGVK